MGIILFTKHGFENLKNELEKQISKRPSAVESLKRGREMGDLSENGLYKAAKMELSNIDRQVRHLKNLILYGKISEPKDNLTIQLGHYVTINDANERKTFQIVGEWEANPKENKISIKSPIGHALMGRGVGERVTIVTPKKTIKYLILYIK